MWGASGDGGKTIEMGDEDAADCGRFGEGVRVMICARGLGLNGRYGRAPRPAGDADADAEAVLCSIASKFRRARSRDDRLADFGFLIGDTATPYDPAPDSTSFSGLQSNASVKSPPGDGLASCTILNFASPSLMLTPPASPSLTENGLRVLIEPVPYVNEIVMSDATPIIPLFGIAHTPFPIRRRIDVHHQQ